MFPTLLMWTAQWVPPAESGGTHWAAIITTAAALVAAGGVWWAARQAQLARRSWITQTTSGIWDGWNETADARRAADAYGDAAGLKQRIEELGPATEEYGKLLAEPNYFEELGVLVELKGVDFDFVRRHLGPVVVERWALWEPAIEVIRERGRQAGQVRGPKDQAYRAFQDLATRMREALGRSL